VEKFISILGFKLVPARFRLNEINLFISRAILFEVNGKIGKVSERVDF
ncbi:MAG: hypothetical protein UV28_C0002G0050, partial [Candidatus Collierbacteria bacterium GW2011_GWE2_42_48]